MNDEKDPKIIKFPNKKNKKTLEDEIEIIKNELREINQFINNISYDNKSNNEFLKSSNICIWLLLLILTLIIFTL